MLWITEAMNDIRVLPYLYSPQSHFCPHTFHCTVPCTVEWSAAWRKYNLKLTSSVFAIMETASVCCSCTLAVGFFLTLMAHVQTSALFLMTLTGPSVGDVLLDTPGWCAGARWLCIIDPFGGEWMPDPCYAYLCGPTGRETHRSWSCTRGLAW